MKIKLKDQVIMPNGAIAQVTALPAAGFAAGLAICRTLHNGRLLKMRHLVAPKDLRPAPDNYAEEFLFASAGQSVFRIKSAGLYTRVLRHTL